MKECCQEGGRPSHECSHGAARGCMCGIDTASPMIGQKLPDFELRVYHEGKDKKMNISDLHGRWVVLFFYPADFTFVCPTELEDMAEHYGAFQKAGAEVLSVSTDTVFVHKAWHDTSKAVGKIQFPMVADPSGALCCALNTYIETGDDAGLSLRSTVIVDPDGRIQVYEVHANNIGRSAQEILRKLQAAIFVREHGGEVCPANWKPGGKTLKPGMDLVGKI